LSLEEKGKDSKITWSGIEYSSGCDVRTLINDIIYLEKVEETMLSIEEIEAKLI